MELEAPFTTAEIDDVVKKMPRDKSLGPDGFNVAFHKSCWHIVVPNFYKLIEDFYEGKVNLQSINYSFITLIPKEMLLCYLVTIDPSLCSTLS